MSARWVTSGQRPTRGAVPGDQGQHDRVDRVDGVERVGRDDVSCRLVWIEPDGKQRRGGQHDASHHDGPLGPAREHAKAARCHMLRRKSNAKGAGRMLRILTMMAVLGLPARAVAAPCTTPTSACAEWITLGGGHARSLVYRSYPLDGRNDRIRRALIMVHGSDRDAQGYFQIGIAAARLAGALDDTIVISPRFASRDGLTCRDTLAAEEINWPCEGNSWRSGGNASGTTLTSFDLADEILRKAAARPSFRISPSSSYPAIPRAGSS